MTWREEAAPIIERIIREVGRDNPKMLRKAFRDAYPFGEKKRFPYKAWLAEIKRQLNGCKLGERVKPRCKDTADMFEDDGDITVHGMNEMNFTEGKYYD